MRGSLVELCAGTASLSLWALSRLPPLCGYMGSKRRLAPLLVEVLGCDRPSHVTLVDAGPWGETWLLLKDPDLRAMTSEKLREWQRMDRDRLWSMLVSSEPYEHPAWRVAQFLWLQARSAGTIPVWWSEERARWESPTGSRTEAAHTRGGSALAHRQKGAPKSDGPAYQTGDGSGDKVPRGCRGIQSPATIASRIDALVVLPWDRITVVHGDCRTVDLRADLFYLDPPYLGCPRYASLLTRDAVLELAQRHGGHARVAISEAEPLLLPGWEARRLPARKPEWLTANFPLRLSEQIDLWGAA